MTAELTLGAEEELHLIDLESRRLSARAPQLLARLPEGSFAAEMQRTTVETNTAPVDSLDGLREEILRLRRELLDVAGSEGLGIAAAGSAPRSEYSDFELTTSGRFGQMHEQYRMLVDEQLICGTHLHVGVSDRETAVQAAGRVAPMLPTLLALSASSPFWNGHDTGYASFRTVIWQRWPSAGPIGALGSAKEYDELVQDLIQTGVIADEQMAYFDLRPSAHAPTLELRLCDATPLVDDAVLIAGLFRAAVRAAEQDLQAGRPFEPLPPAVLRAGSWQAARTGLSGDLLTDARHPVPAPAPEVVRDLVARLRPQLEESGDLDAVLELSEATLARGNSADRQRAAFAERGELDDVVDLVLRETQGPAGGPPATAAPLRGYRSRAGDEAVGPGWRPRAAYEGVIDTFRERDADQLERLGAATRAWSEDAGLVFGGAGGHHTMAIDVVPRILSAHEWEEIRRGLAQRARALESLLRDAYGARRAVADGVVPEADLLGRPGWRDEGCRLPDDVVRAPIMGFDLVRNEFGGWRVLEDNVRVPSGITYALAARRMLDELLPELPRPRGLIDPRSAVGALRATILHGLGPQARGGLLSSGPANSAWAEHRQLAEQLGLRLVTADDLEIRDGRVRTRDGDRVLDALYIRLDDELAELTAPDGQRLGEAIIDVAAARGVVLVNTPGTGVADDKAMYRHVPELISYYLDERPLLESVPTYRTDDDSERRIVIDRASELVTKPVDGAGGSGVLVGPTASPGDIRRRRREIADRPDAWIAQERVQLSSHPTLSGHRLEPRHVDLRAFVFVRGTGPDDVVVADAALTRVAPAGTMVVNSSQGGGIKDTWLLDVTGESGRAERGAAPSAPRPSPRE